MLPDQALFDVQSPQHKQPATTLTLINIFNLIVFQVHPLNAFALSLEQYGTSFPHSDTVSTIVGNEDLKSEASAFSSLE